MYMGVFFEKTTLKLIKNLQKKTSPQEGYHKDSMRTIIECLAKKRSSSIILFIFVVLKRHQQL